MLIACYGSLKKGFYNHRALGEDAKFLGTSSVLGVMYSNGSYPKLYKPGISTNEADNFLREELERQHELEIYDISGSNYRDIRGMELGAGYEEEDIETEWGPTKIYWMPHQNFNEDDKWIESYSLEK